MKFTFFIGVLATLLTICSCRNNNEIIIQKKLNCYQDKLRTLKEMSLYKELMTQFLDTFEVIKNDVRFFGLSKVVANRVDEAVFFNKDSTECILLVLQMSNTGFVFGKARVVHGFFSKGHWYFEPSLDFTYDKEFENKYKSNFSSISTLARRSVLTEGDVKEGGCDIDDRFWFKELQR